MSAQERTAAMKKSGGIMKIWNKRFICCSNGVFFWFKNKTDEKPVTAINLEIANNIDVAEEKSKPNCFQIVTPQCTFVFSMETSEERDKWIGLLQMEKSNKKFTDLSGGVSINDFEVLHLIGKGGMGKVMQVRKKDSGGTYAMKVIYKKHIIANKQVEHTLAEKSVLQKLRHPFLVNLHYAFQTDDRLCLILDYVNGGELFYVLQKQKKFSEDRARFYAAEILLALECLHANGIIYRDLKPENILFTSEGHICLTDFGLCKEGIESDTDRTATFCGTPEYLAPEILLAEGYGKAVDWWSFGCVVYEMMVGLPPFYSKNMQEMYKRITNCELKYPESMSQKARGLIGALLKQKLQDRLVDANNIKAHPFFEDVDFTAIYEKEVPPPYVPDVKSEEDLSQIDPEFLAQNPNADDLDIAGLNDEEQQNFNGFTFVNASRRSVMIPVSKVFK